MPRTARYLIAVLAVAAAAGCAGTHRNAVPSHPHLARGGLVGAIRVGGGLVLNTRLKAAGRVSVLNGRGQVVAVSRVAAGHDFRFRLAAGRYRLGLGGHPRVARLGGCRPAVVTVRPDRITHADLWYGCAFD